MDHRGVYRGGVYQVNANPEWCPLQSQRPDQTDEAMLGRYLGRDAEPRGPWAATEIIIAPPSLLLLLRWLVAALPVRNAIAALTVRNGVEWAGRIGTELVVKRSRFELPASSMVAETWRRAR